MFVGVQQSVSTACSSDNDNDGADHEQSTIVVLAAQFLRKANPLN
jgi:hypothetical protein